jgi:hypothetical protein
MQMPGRGIQQRILISDDSAAVSCARDKRLRLFLYINILSESEILLLIQFTRLPNNPQMHRAATARVIILPEHLPSLSNKLRLSNAHSNDFLINSHIVQCWVARKSPWRLTRYCWHFLVQSSHISLFVTYVGKRNIMLVSVKQLA